MGGTAGRLAVAVSPIPIENVYYLFCYAWDLFREGAAVPIGSETSPDLPNLLARVLASGTATLLRRGLDRAYQPMQEDLATIRGQIDMPGTIALQTRRLKRVDCLYDELSPDTLHNRILKASLLRLSKAPTLDRAVARELLKLALHFREVADVSLSTSTFGRVQLHRNNAHYQLLLHVARLAFDSLLPTESGEGFRFYDVLADATYMPGIFEAFVRNFYRREQTALSVQPLIIQWDAVCVQDSGVPLPQMKVDIYLRNQKRDIIIDTKFYADALQSNRGHQSFHSDNLYQLFGYLKNVAADPAFKRAEGILLYPEVQRELDARFVIQGHSVRIATVNLAQPWQGIRERLLDLVSQTGPNMEAA